MIPCCLDLGEPGIGPALARLPTMAAEPLELTLDITPRARFDAIDVRARVSQIHGDVLRAYPRALYCSFHTTAGYLDQSLAWRLGPRVERLTDYMETFRAMFPEGARYRHDDLDRREDLSDEQREVEPRNADSHLAFMAAGLKACVSYQNLPDAPVVLVDLDGVNHGCPRQRTTGIVGYSREVDVWRTRVQVPVSGHPIDSINLRDPNLGLYDLVAEMAVRHGVAKGRVRLELAVGERQAGLTVNEYETLLMRHDLREVLRDPLRFMAEKGRHALRDPRAIPSKTRGYAAYDLVQALNRLVDALGLEHTWIERLLGRAMALPAARFLRMKRSVSLLVSDRNTPGLGAIVEGTYQRPILVQWHESPSRTRQLDLTLSRFD
jgi:thiamine phosphate synthase YjbQ (UPF0047 family)